MTTPQATETVLATWATPRGDKAKWLSDGALWLRRYSRGWKQLCTVASIKMVNRKLVSLRLGQWTKYGATTRANARTDGRKCGLISLVEGLPSGTVDRYGVTLLSGDRRPLPTEGVALARVAAMAIRAASLGGDHWDNPAVSITDSPLTVGELVAALDDPRSPLTDDERAAALAALTG